MQNKLSNYRRHLGMAIFVCCLSSFFYLYDFFLRVMPSAMTQMLMERYNIGAASLGVLSAMFLYAYTPMQIPVGLLYDRFSARSLLTINILICAVATYIFAISDNFYVANIAFFIMGFGSAFAFVGPLLLVSRWFPPSFYACAVGIIQLMGCVGAIIGEKPVALMIDKYGAQHAIMIFAVVGLIGGILFYFLIKDYPPGVTPIRKQPAAKSISEWQRLWLVCRNSQNWAVGLYSIVCWAPMTIFASLWGVPYLASLYNISTPEAALMMSWIWVGVGVGGAFLGWWSDHIGLRKLPLMIAMIMGLVSSTLIVYVHLPMPMMAFMLFCFGFVGSAQAVTFGLFQDNNHETIAGTAAGFNNMMILIGGMAMQPVVGMMLDSYASKQGTLSSHVFSVAAYQHSLFVLPLCSIIGIFATMVLIKETHCKSNAISPGVGEELPENKLTAEAVS